MAKVAIIFTGGTIATRPSAEAGGNVPVLDGAAILARAPEVASFADVEVLDWGMVPASHLRFGQMLSIARLVAEQLSRPDIDGAVIVQGTDVIEETSFAYDLLLATDKPVVITGAMRNSSAPDYDGSRNLADSVRWAASVEAHGTGAVVILDGTVIAADVVVKRDSVALDTFQPRTGPPLAVFLDGSLVPVSVRSQRRVLPRVPAEAVEDVSLIMAVAGIDGSLVRGIAPLHPRGLVVAATGSGNTHPDLLAAAADLAADGHDARFDDALRHRHGRRRSTPSPAAARCGSAPGPSCRRSTGQSRASHSPLAWRLASTAPRSCSLIGQ